MSNSTNAWRVRLTLSRENAEPASVRDKTPQVLVRAIEKLLEHPVGAGTVGTGRAGLASIQLDPIPDEVDRCVAPGMGKRVRLALDRHGLGGKEPTVPETIKQGQEPPVAGVGHGRIGIRQLAQDLPELPPLLGQPVPGVVDGLVKSLVGQVIGLGLETIQVAVSVHDPLQ